MIFFSSFLHNLSRPFLLARLLHVTISSHYTVDVKGFGLAVGEHKNSIIHYPYEDVSVSEIKNWIICLDFSDFILRICHSCSDSVLLRGAA